MWRSRDYIAGILYGGVMGATFAYKAPRTGWEWVLGAAIALCGAYVAWRIVSADDHPLGKQ